MLADWLLELPAGLRLAGAGYLLGGILTTGLFCIACRHDLSHEWRRVGIRGLLKVCLLWPAVVGIGAVFAAITIGTRIGKPR